MLTFLSQQAANWMPVTHITNPIIVRVHYVNQKLLRYVPTCFYISIGLLMRKWRPPTVRRAPTYNAISECVILIYWLGLTGCVAV